MKDSYLTPEEVASVLKLSKFTVYEMIKRGELPASKIGRALRIMRGDLETLLNGHKTTDPISTQQDHLVDMENSLSVQAVTSVANFHACDIVFAGSHDLTMDVLVHHLNLKGITLLPIYSGSLEGLIELYKGRAELAGSHLLNQENGTYNLSHISCLLPNDEVTVVNLVHRWQGFIVPKGNPRMITDWQEFFSGRHRIVNRQKGSGTRVLLDQKMKEYQVTSDFLPGYDLEAVNHYATASEVIKGNADVALGIESVARHLGLDFFPMQKERYDLIIPTKLLDQQRFQILMNVLRDTRFKQAVVALGGYDISQTGHVITDIS